MTTIKYELKFVRNLGNFESAHVGFGIEDSLRDGETPDQAKARIVAKVNSWVQAEIEAIDNEAK